MNGADLDTLAWLETWYESQCDGNWEHQYGIDIGNIDNPGWIVSIDLTETDLASRPFAQVNHNMDHVTDWYTCRVADQKFTGAGGPRHLRTILEVFRTWATSD